MGNLCKSSAEIIEGAAISAKRQNFARFLPINNKSETSKITMFKTTEFKILSYNILADCYSKINWFPGCTARSLSFEKRSVKIVNEFGDI